MRGLIRQRSKGTWTIHWDEPRGADGKRRQRNKSIRGTKREAEAELRKILASLDSGNYITPSKLTVRGLLEHWLDNYVATNTRPRTAEGYRMICEKHLAPNLGGIVLTQLQPAHVQSYYAAALKAGRADGKGGLSARTLSHHHRVLSEALEWGIKQGLLARNVCKQVTPPRPVAKEMHVLSEYQVEQLLNIARPTQYYHLIRLALYTGMRRSEVLGLRWKDADMVLSAVRVTQGLHRLANQQTVFTSDFRSSLKREKPPISEGYLKLAGSVRVSLVAAGDGPEDADHNSDQDRGADHADQGDVLGRPSSSILRGVDGLVHAEQNQGEDSNYHQ